MERERKKHIEGKNRAVNLRILREASRPERERRANCLSRKINARRAFIASSEMEKCGHASIVGSIAEKARCSFQSRPIANPATGTAPAIRADCWINAKRETAKERKMVPTSESR